jgi:TolB-like protein
MREWKMGAVKSAFGIFSALLLLSACNSTPVTGADPAAYSRSAAAVESGGTLDSALLESSRYLSARLPEKSTVAVIFMQSPTENLSNYCLDGLAMHLVNMEKFAVIERSELGLIQQEQQYQLSGEVSDETAVSIGRQLGTEYIITGSLLPLGDAYSFRIKAIRVETGQIAATQRYQVRKDRTVLALLEPPPPVARTAEQPPAKQEAPQTVIQGDVNITTNNNTTINGDVYINKPNGFSWE